MLEKRYIPEEQEARWQQAWEAHGTHTYKPDPMKTPYSIDTPPPTVSGSLHVGHIFSYTQAEMIARFRRMTGHALYYPFGFDDNGLPTERLIERETHTDTRAMTRDEVLALGKPIVERHEAAFQDLWRSLGFSCDWNLAYQTMSPQVQRISQASFLDLARRGLAYPDEQPTLWCPHCRTSIAQADLDTKEADTLFNTIRFQLAGDAYRFLPVATTRPEMLYGCVCLFIHPEHPVLSGFIGQRAIVPVYGHEVPILGNPDADPDKGTGVVMCCTFGDAADAAWYRTYSLPYRKVLEPDGTLAREIPELGGMTLRRARPAIIGLLEERGLLIRTEPLSHQVGVHERCGTEAELLPSRQWYIRLLENRERFLQAAEEIQWYPAAMKHRYVDWVEGLKWDWCVSRQRRFGIPIPLWYCGDCGAPILPEDADLPLNPAETAPKAPCARCGGTGFTPETSVLDTWATSSITPRINAARQASLSGRTDFLPMTMRTQAHEIIRTWAFYTIVRSLYADGTLPWRDLMVCGYVMAGKGEKISKSKNNASVEPTALIRTHSADAVRYWAAGAKLGTDTAFRAEELDLSRRFMTKLWNAARFSAIHLETMTEADWRIATLLPADQWLICRYNETLADVRNAFLAYESGDARKRVDAFFWSDFCDNWLELAKDRLYKPETHGAAATAGAKVTLHRVLAGILKLYAPFVPHLTETIWQALYADPAAPFASLHETEWAPIPLPEGAPEASLLRTLGDLLTDAIADARRQKTLRGLSMKDPVDRVEIRFPQSVTEEDLVPLAGMLAASLGDLRACTGAQEILLPRG